MISVQDIKLRFSSFTRIKTVGVYGTVVQ